MTHGPTIVAIAVALLSLPLQPSPGPSPQSPTTIHDRNVVVPMRDGVQLRADLLRPSSQGQFPTLVYRTPYGKDDAPSCSYGRNSPADPSNVLRAGHRVRVQISATFFPNFSRNLHTGDLETVSARRQKATISIHHDRERPSQVSLHAVDRE